MAPHRELQAGFLRYCLGISYHGKTFSGWIGNSKPINPIITPLNVQSDGSLEFIGTDHDNGCEEAKISYEHKTMPPSWETKPYVAPNVVHKLESAIHRFSTGKYMNLKGSSRTDAGVHAIRNTCQVDLQSRVHHRTNQFISAQQIMRGINFHLQHSRVQDLFVRDVTQVDGDFDARYDATARTYMYRILAPRVYIPGKWYLPNLFHQETAWVLDRPLSVDRMQAAAIKLIGEHDFSSFRGKNCQSLSSHRRIQNITIESLSSTSLSSQMSYDPHLAIFVDVNGWDMITITITANSFLKRMVRNIVGMLVEVGKESGCVGVDDVEMILSRKSRVLNLCNPAPAHGLFLVDVHYDKLS